MLNNYKKPTLPVRHMAKDQKKNYSSDRVDMVALYKQLTGNALRKTGRAYIGICPFHKDNSPSFAIYVDTDSVFCFSCKFSAKGSYFAYKLKKL